MDKQQRKQFVAALNDYVLCHWSEEEINAAEPPFGIHKEASTDQELLIGASVKHLSLMDVERKMAHILKDILQIPKLPEYHVVSQHNNEYDTLHIPEFKHSGHEVYTLPADALNNIDYDTALAALQKAKQQTYLSNAKNVLKAGDTFPSAIRVPSAKTLLNETFRHLSEKGVAPADIAAIAHEVVIDTMKNALPPEQQVEFMQELGKKMGLSAARGAKREVGR